MCWPRMPASAMYWSVNSARAPGDLVEHLGDEVLEIEDLHALGPSGSGRRCRAPAARPPGNGTSSNRSRSSSSGGRLRSSSPGRCRQTFLSLPISEGTCRPFVMASYLSFGPFWPNLSAPFRNGHCLLTALVISKFHPQFHLAPERSTKCDERYIACDSPMMHFSSLKHIFKGKCSFF